MKAQLLNNRAMVEILNLHSSELNKRYSPLTCQLFIHLHSTEGTRWTWKGSTSILRCRNAYKHSKCRAKGNKLDTLGFIYGGNTAYFPNNVSCL